MDARVKVLSFLQANGPSLPIAVKREIGGDSFLASAYLSELKEQGKVRISHLKVGGGSPLYYVPEHASRLQRFADNLGEKERKVFDLLRARKVLRDAALVPVFRAAVRSIRDFARHFTVTHQGIEELFWRYYLTPQEEAQAEVKRILGIPEKKQEPKKEETKPEAPQKEAQVAKKQDVQPDEKEEQEPLQQDTTAVSPFHKELLDHFSKNNIKILEQDVIRKQSEIDFIVEVPSSVGSLRYYVKAKSKKKVGDGDLSTAFLKGQGKRLPVLFVTKGELTKKAQGMLESEFGGLKVSRLGR